MSSKRDKFMAAPSSSDTDDDRFLRHFLIGNLLGGVAYGVHIALFLECMFLLVLRPKEKIKWLLVIFVFLNFIFGSMQFGIQAKICNMTIVDQVYFHNYADAWDLVSFIVGFASTWMSDGLLVYRLFMFWSGNWKVIALPSLTLAGTIASAILITIKSVHITDERGGPLLTGLISAYWALTFATNSYVSISIVGRIIFLQRKIDSLLSSHPSSQSSWHARLCSLFKPGRAKDGESRNPYDDEPGTTLRASLRSRSRGTFSSISFILLESAALYTICMAIFEGTYVASNGSSLLFSLALGHIPAISALMIIVRVARGTAWTRNHIVELSAITGS